MMGVPAWFFDRLLQLVLEQASAMPWQGWLATLVLMLALAGLACWWMCRVVRRVGAAALAAARHAAHGDQAARRRIHQALNSMSLTTALSVSLVVAQGFGALGISRVLKEHAEVPVPFNWLGFAAFQALAVILMAIINERAEQGLPARGVTAGFWALIAVEAVLNTTHSDNMVGRAVFAAMTLIAACGYQLRMGQKRRGRDEELRRAEGRWANRRIAAVRWLHPIERIAVAVELARDEDLGADAATRLVRDRSAAQRRARLRRRAARALWRLRIVQMGGRWARMRHPGAERRAQAALDAAGLAEESAELVAVLRRVQVLTLADRIADTDYTDPAGARGLVASLITDEALQRLELPPPGPSAPEPGWGPDGEEHEVPETPPPAPWTETDPQWEAFVIGERTEQQESGGVLIPLTGTGQPNGQLSVAQIRAARAAGEPARTLPAHERYDTARRLWSQDPTVTGAGMSTARRWRSTFADEHTRPTQVGLPHEESS